MYAVGGGSVLLRFDGSAWSEGVRPLITFHSGVWGSDPQNAWALAFSGNASVLKTSDGGLNWVVQHRFDFGGPKARDLWGTSDSQIVAVGPGGAAFHYDGIAWTLVPTGVSQDLNDVWGVAPD